MMPSPPMPKCGSLPQDGERSGIGYRLFETVEIDVAVTAAVHLGEGQLHTGSLLGVWNKNGYERAEMQSRRSYFR